MRPISAALLAALLLSATACGGGESVDLGPVNEAIDVIETAQGDLRTRMSDIESSVTALGSASGDPEAAAGLLEQLDSLELMITTLQAEFDQYVIDDAAAAEELRGLLASLESTLAGVTTSLSSIRSDISDLREDHELLKQRFERHLQDNNG